MKAKVLCLCAFIFINFNSYSCELTDILKRELILASPYKVRDISCSNGRYHWSIDNFDYLSKLKGNIRELSSIHSTSDLRQVSENKVTKLSKSDQFLNNISLQLNSEFVSLTSTDNISQVTERSLSNIGAGLNMTWAYSWSETFSLSIFGSFKKYEFKMGDGRSLSKTTVTTKSTELALFYHFSPRVTLGTHIGIGEELFLDSERANLFSIDNAIIPTTALSLENTIYQFNQDAHIYMRLKAGLFIPSTQDEYKTDLGSFQDLGLGSRFKAWNTQFNIISQYRRKNLKRENNKVLTEEIGLTAEVVWSF